MSTVHSSEHGTAPDLLAVPLAPVSLVDGVAERFRQAVINHTLKPGDEVNESQLAERLNVSRGTIREALRILIGEGLLEKLPNRTSRVRQLTPEKAWEVSTARAIIEGFAAGLLARRPVPDKAETLQRIWQQLYAAAQANDRAAFATCDFALHQAIMQMAGHELLLDTWTKMSAWIRLMFASESYTPQELIANAMNHRRIIDAILSGDAEHAEAVLKADLMNQQELLRSAARNGAS